MTNRWWTGLKDVAHSIVADEAPPEVQRERAATCAGCEHMVPHRAIELYGMKAAPRFGTCGKFLRPTDTTCGCLVLAESEDWAPLQINGRYYQAAGKLTVSDAKCPQGRW